MLFNSVSFLLFFPLVVLVYFAIPDKAKNCWLLIASYYFYMSWQPVYALLILFSTASTYICAVWIDQAKTQKQRKLFLAVNIVVNLAILFYFKYFNFFITSLTTLLPGFELAPNANLLAVVGISFYTFQSLGYSIDVYRGTIPREKNFLTYALFVSFFPQLVAGPIERSANLLPQFKTPNRFEYTRVSNGLKLMAWGFLKKLVIADGAAQIINAVYNEPTSYTGIQLVVATILFAFQIYGDFSGYSDIAIGAAQVLGFQLMRNFNHPYFAKSVPEFWRRWHISLSSWFMDYVYIPLGGSRKGPWRTYFNLMVTFLVSGLWHGAAWTFVVWGGLNGFYNVISRATKNLRQKTAAFLGVQNSFLRAGVGIVFTFLLINFSWIFFRANSLSDALYVIQNLTSDFSCWFDPNYINQALTKIGFYTGNGYAIIGCIVFVLGMELWEGNGDLITKISSCHWALRWIFYYTIILLIIFFGWFGKSQFIYFQF